MLHTSHTLICLISPHAYRERGVLSVARFCNVFPCELQEPAWAVGSYSFSQSARGTSQNIIFKTLRQLRLYRVAMIPALHLNWESYFQPFGDSRMSSTYVCLHPWQSLWTYGFVVPWVFIAVVAILSAIALVYDWHHDRKAGRFMSHTFASFFCKAFKSSIPGWEIICVLLFLLAAGCWLKRYTQPH